MLGGSRAAGMGAGRGRVLRVRGRVALVGLIAFDVGEIETEQPDARNRSSRDKFSPRSWKLCTGRSEDPLPDCTVAGMVPPAGCGAGV